MCADEVNDEDERHGWGESDWGMLEEIGILLPNNQRQHRTLHIQTRCAAIRIVLVTVPRASRSCEHFLDGFDLHLLLDVGTAFEEGLQWQWDEPRVL